MYLLFIFMPITATSETPRKIRPQHQDAVVHKAIHRYTVRAKAGGAQSACDGGKKARVRAGGGHGTSFLGIYLKEHVEAIGYQKGFLLYTSLNVFFDGMLWVEVQEGGFEKIIVLIEEFLHGRV